MNIINIKLGVDTQPCSAITLGRRGENEVTQVVVDFSSWVEEFGAGVITLLAMRSQDTSAYPVVLSLDGNTATWNVTSTDTAYKGSGRAEYIYTVGEQIAKSVVFNTVVMQDIGEPSETPPDPYEEWLERLTELGAETQANAEAAQTSAEDAERSAQESAQEAANAEGYAEQAGESASAAQSAEAASEAARDAAQTAQARAEASATAAIGSAASAAGSATAAAGSASDASASATAAGASATTASTAAGQAEAAKTAAQTAQSAAEDAAEDAQQAAQQAHVEYEQLSDAVDELADEVAQQKSAIEDLEALTNRKAGMLVDTVSGAIASFVPDSTIPDLLGVSVAVEPVQNLHGYDNPWPAGGGVNKLNEEFEIGGISSTNGANTSQGTTIRTKNFSKVTPSESYFLIVGGTATTAYLFWYATDDVSGYIGSSGGYVSTGAVTVPANANYLRVQLNANYGTTYNNDCAFNYPLTVTSYSPYSNLCPISGWDAVEVDADGENVLALPVYYRATTEVPEMFFIKAGTYTFNCRMENATNWRFGMWMRDADGNNLSDDLHKPYQYWSWYSNPGYWMDGINGTRTEYTVTIAEDCYIRLFFTLGDTTASTVCSNQMLNIGSTATEYKPYAGNRYTIALGNTVYGAKLTVAEDGSVNALVNRVAVDMGDIDWIRQSNGSIAWFAKNMSIMAEPIKPSTSASNFARVQYSAYAYNGFGYTASLQDCKSISNGSVLYVRDDSCATAEDFIAKNAGQQLVYELATPIEIQLDPVTISTISGQTNNVWADAGDVAVEFAADLKHYIDSKIAAAVAALS